MKIRGGEVTHTHLGIEIEEAVTGITMTESVMTTGSGMEERKTTIGKFHLSSFFPKSFIL